MNYTHKEVAYIDRLDNFHKSVHGHILWKAIRSSLGNGLGKLLTRSKHGLVIDYGCGVGHLSRKITQTYDCKVIGFDPQYAKFGQVHERIKFSSKRPEYINAHAIVCSHVLGHCNNPAAELEWMFNHVHQDGIVILAIPSRLYEQANWLRNKLSGYKSDTTLLHRWYGWQLASLCEQVGFVVEHVRPVASVGLFHQSVVVTLRKPYRKANTDNL